MIRELFRIVELNEMASIGLLPELLGKFKEGEVVIAPGEVVSFKGTISPSPGNAIAVAEGISCWNYSALHSSSISDIPSTKLNTSTGEFVEYSGNSNFTNTSAYNDLFVRKKHPNNPKNAFLCYGCYKCNVMLYSFGSTANATFYSHNDTLSNMPPATQIQLDVGILHDNIPTGHHVIHPAINKSIQCRLASFQNDDAYVYDDLVNPLIWSFHCIKIVAKVEPKLLVLEEDDDSDSKLLYECMQLLYSNMEVMCYEMAMETNTVIQFMNDHNYNAIVSFHRFQFRAVIHSLIDKLVNIVDQYTAMKLLDLSLKIDNILITEEKIQASEKLLVGHTVLSF